jgi:S-adenosylmethionine hydrolase
VKHSLITLTTDFSTRDPYVAAMKGVISSICPQARILDLSHNITRHDIMETALFLAASIPYFPPGTIHLVVVDPGVGTERNPVVVSSGAHLFVCPDNGLLTLFVRQHGCDEIRVISHPDCMLTQRSATFDGRDIFAPTAARLACGFPFARVGKPLKALQLLPVPQPKRTGRTINGLVIHIDAFGNLITNIPSTIIGNREWQHTGMSAVGMPASTDMTVRIRDHQMNFFGETYGSVPAGEPVVLWGSSGYLEIAFNQGSAAERLECKVGERVEAHIKD